MAPSKGRLALMGGAQLLEPDCILKAVALAIEPRSRKPRLRRYHCSQ